MKTAYVTYAVWVPLGYTPGDAARIEFYGAYGSREDAVAETEARHCDLAEVEVRDGAL